jgi:hypothetical protein
MKKILLSILSLSAAWLGLSGYSAGPGLSGMNLTGSQSFPAGCGQGCHNNVSPNTAVVVAVDSAGTGVTSYVPGMTYTIQVVGLNITSLPACGFQLSVVKGTGTNQSQAGTFSGLPANVHTAVVNGITVVEHSSPIVGVGGVYTISFQWTAPAAGAGTISIYAVLNAVNQNGLNTGDEFNFSVTTVTESTTGCPLPIVSTQPIADTACAGSAAGFTVSTSTTGVSYQWYKNGAAITGATNASYSIPSVASTDAGNYSVRLTNICGTTISDTVGLVVNPLPVPTINQVGFNLSTGSFSSYQWLKNNLIIPGATLQNYTVTSNGSYRVLVTNSNGCSDTSNAVSITNVSVAEVNGEKKVSIYPNPVQSQLFIDAKGEVNVTIRDIRGQKVVDVMYTRGNIDVTSLSPGVYSVYITDKNGQLLHAEHLAKW